MKKLRIFLFSVVLVFFCSPPVYAQDISGINAHLTELKVLLTKQAQLILNLQTDLNQAKESLTNSDEKIKELETQLTAALKEQERLQTLLNDALKSLESSKNSWILPAAISGVACFLLGLLLSPK